MVGKAAQAKARSFWIARARIPEALLETPLRRAIPATEQGYRRAHLLIADGRIAAISGDPPSDGLPIVDMADGIVTSCWVDAHTHLDKSHTGPRIGLYSHSLAVSVAASGQDRARWTEEDLRRRMSFSLRTAWAHGTRAMRSHIDWVAADAPCAWHVAKELRAEWAGRLELQLASICPLPLFGQPAAGDAIARILAQGGGVLGASVHPVPHQRALLEAVFELAVRHGLDLDFHVDEHLQPDVGGMRAIVELTERHRWQGRVACGHCCALSVAPPRISDSVLQQFAAAGIALICLPYANLQLQDGMAGRTPRLRGIAPILEAASAGVNVCLASDNVRDAFVPFADFDPLQLLANTSLAAHLNDPMARWIGSVTVGPATAMQLRWDGRLRCEAPADLVLLEGRNSFEVCSRPRRRVLRGGQFIDASPPDFRELDARGT
ncbi:MAG: cytosine deaminase [Ramlibacter sp.]|nr:cytosine deaminase [Ramlibacter sp.]